MNVNVLWAVRARARNSRRITGSLSPALDGEGGLAVLVDVWVGAFVLSRSRSHGKIFTGSADHPPAGEAVTGTGGFVGNLRAQQVGKTVTKRLETEIFTF